MKKEKLKLILNLSFIIGLIMLGLSLYLITNGIMQFNFWSQALVILSAFMFGIPGLFFSITGIK